MVASAKEGPDCALILVVGNRNVCRRSMTEGLLYVASPT
jgi:hypothetical protein